MNTLSTIKPNLYNKNRFNLLHYSFEGGTATDLYNSYHGTLGINSISSTFSKYGSYSAVSEGIAYTKKYVIIPTIAIVNESGLSFSLFLYTIAQPITDSKIFELTVDKLVLMGRAASDNYYFGNVLNENGSDFTMPLATWNHLVITVDQMSTINIYVNNVLTITETPITTIYPTGKTINPSLSPASRGKINRSIISTHVSHNGYTDDFKIFNRVLSATDVNGLFTNSYFP